MKHVLRRAAVMPVAALLLACPRLWAGDGPAARGAGQIDWVKDFDTALRLAAARNVPILVAVNSEVTARLRGERDVNRRIAAEAYRDPAVVRATRKFVCLVASPDRHIDGAGAGGAACPRFGGVGCEDHRAVADAVRLRFNAGAELDGPEHLILDPEGRLVSRHWQERSAAGLVGLLARAWARHEEDTARRIAGALRSRREAERTAALRAGLRFLGQCEASGPVHRTVARYLKSAITRDRDRRRAWQLIAEAGTPAALALVLPWLEAKSPRLRTDALEVFAGAAPHPGFLRALAARAGKERSVEPLLALVRVLERYAVKLPEAFGPLNRLVRRREEAVGVAATLAAARPANDAIASTLLARARKEANPRLRAAAILGLARMNARSARPALEKLRRKLRGRAGRGSVVARALDLALACLSGAAGAGRFLEDEVDRLKTESGAGGAAKDEPRDRTDRKWRRGPGGRV